MLSAYPAIFIKEENGYSVIFPDLNYLATCGKTVEDAFSMAIDCLAGYLFSAKLDKETITKPSDMKMIDVKKAMHYLEYEFDDYFVNLVTVDVDDYARLHFNKSVKKTLTIPEWLNREALAHDLNFSQILQEALINKLRSL